eukprot:TRINITY_DN2612_c0_g1_i7.p1 TRINITY_DN2612_c0_g1~~TRINITY_DN2612_c0_g1_i7.p1  ORF type:complete len:289 (-),score=74.87 TRINITY_DN2612_c0_g1_i7:224-964(-)
MDKGVYMSTELLRAAKTVYVLSPYGKRLATLLGGTRIKDLFLPPPEDISLPEPIEIGDDSSSDDVVWIGTPGYVISSKSPDLLIQAFGIVHAMYPHKNLKLVFFGNYEPEYATQLTSLLAANHPEAVNSVIFTGGLSKAEYESWFTRLSVCVILRKISNGEMSAAFADAMAFGVPVISQRIGPFSDFGHLAHLVGFDTSGEEIAKAISEIIDNPSEKQRLHDAGLEYSKTFNFARFASMLLEPTQE